MGVSSPRPLGSQQLLVNSTGAGHGSRPREPFLVIWVQIVWRGGFGLDAMAIVAGGARWYARALKLLPKLVVFRLDVVLSFLHCKYFSLYLSTSHPSFFTSLSNLFTLLSRTRLWARALHAVRIIPDNGYLGLEAACYVPSMLHPCV